MSSFHFIISSSFHLISFHNQSLRSFTAGGGCRHRGTIKRGLDIERARLGTLRGFGTERARLGTFRGFGTERARLGTFRGFLKKFQKTSQFDPNLQLVIVKLGVDFRKTVLPAQILIFFSGPPTSPNF